MHPLKQALLFMMVASWRPTCTLAAERLVAGGHATAVIADYLLPAAATTVANEPSRNSIKRQ
jgi:hypothetical protein